MLDPSDYLSQGWAARKPASQPASRGTKMTFTDRNTRLPPSDFIGTHLELCWSRLAFSVFLSNLLTFSYIVSFKRYPFVVMLLLCLVHCI